MQGTHLPQKGLRIDVTANLRACRKHVSAFHTACLLGKSAKHHQTSNSVLVRCAAAVQTPPMAAAGRVKLGSSDLEVSGQIAYRIASTPDAQWSQIDRGMQSVASEA